jgi:phosphatidylserine decarboxylase
MKIDRAGLPFVAVAALLTLVVALWIGPLSAIPAALLVLFVVWFFRDPHRVAPDDSRVLVSPADGKILVASSGKISVFMNVFNVHVCRTPLAGRVRDVTRVSGKFLAAYRDDAAEHNERATIVIDAAPYQVRFTLVAGLIARRIVCRVHAGQELEIGQRVGLIRFGSRVDLVFPADSELRVRRGERVVAGQTVLALLPKAPDRVQAR